jgi:transcriptional regulator with GAF, ATPase, and Fis domain
MSDAGDPQRLKLLFELGCAFAERIELDELIPLVVEKCRQTLAVQGVSVMMLDRDRNELYFPYVSQDNREVAERLSALRFPADRGLAGEALSTGRAVKVDDAQNDPRLYREVDRHTGMMTRSLMAVPLISSRGPVGVIEAINPVSGAPFGADDLNFLETLAGGIAVALENARLHGQIKESEARLRTQVAALRSDIERDRIRAEMIGTGQAMERIFRLMEAAAASDITVLIQGETGTGKELVARGIHRASARGDRPFMVINCAAVPEALLESELFGHRRGAFTGAVRDQIGLLRAADGGVVFLDEIGDMPITMQAKLLRFLENGEVIPIGEARAHRTDVRVLCATNRDLREEVARRNFREDLYYRVAAFPITLPPLRERREDIPPLASRFTTAAAERDGRRIGGIDAAAMKTLVNYDWPGNVRELLHAMERAVAIAPEGQMITVAELAPWMSSIIDANAAVDPNASEMPPTETKPMVPPKASAVPPAQIAPPQGAAVVPLREARSQFEAEYLRNALSRCGGNVSKAARMVGVSRVSLQKKMKEYGLRQG